MKLDHVRTPLLVAQRVEAKDLQTVVLIAGHVQGDVKTLFTPLTALAAGAGFAVTLFTFKSLVTNVARLLAQRKKTKRK